MKVIILAVGREHRFSPMTIDKPKCMLKTCSKSVLQYQFENLETRNINPEESNG